MSKRPADMTDIAPDDMARRTAQNAAPMRRRMRHISLVVVSILAVLVAGLQHFVLTLPKPLSTQPEYTDGIVVMTGGQQRLTDGIQLLSDGFASKLLISGVGKGVDRDILVRELDLNQSQTNSLFCCVELDHAAQDTRGNADIAHQWAKTHRMASLRLVTANYHMPRALLVFSRKMPDITLYQWPVNPDDLKLDRWWYDPALIRLLAREYAKFLTVYFSV